MGAEQRSSDFFAQLNVRSISGAINSDLLSNNRLALSINKGSKASTISGSDHKVVDSCLSVNDNKGISHQTVPLWFLEFESITHIIINYYSLFTGSI